MISYIYYFCCYVRTEIHILYFCKITYFKIHLAVIYWTSFDFIGIFFVLPCIETYQKVDLRTITLDVPPQEVWSSMMSSLLISHVSRCCLCLSLLYLDVVFFLPICPFFQWSTRFFCIFLFILFSLVLLFMIYFFSYNLFLAVTYSTIIITKTVLSMFLSFRYSWFKVWNISSYSLLLCIGNICLFYYFVDVLFLYYSNL